MTLGEKIREERKKRGLSRLALANMLGMADTTLQYIENGTTKLPHKGNLRKIAALLEIDLEELELAEYAAEGNGAVKAALKVVKDALKEDDPRIMAIAERIRDERKRKGITQETLAAVAGVARNTVCVIEIGRRPAAGDKVLFKIASALEIDPKELGVGAAAAEKYAVTEMIKTAAKFGQPQKGFCPRFAYCRKATGHTRSDAAKQLGISQNTLGAIEACSVVPTAPLILKMAALYGVSCDYLLGHRPDTYDGRFCMFVYCEAGELHDHCCADCQHRASCEVRCENSPAKCGGVRTRRPNETIRDGKAVL